MNVRTVVHPCEPYACSVGSAVLLTVQLYKQCSGRTTSDIMETAVSGTELKIFADNLWERFQYVDYSGICSK